MKENKDYSDAISAANFQAIEKLGGDITTLSNDVARVSRNLNKTAGLCHALKQDARLVRIIIINNILFVSY